MAFSDRLDSHRSNQATETEPGAATTTSVDLEPADTEANDVLLEKRVALPKPDVTNITVLTESLPNDPILPWHHFDSPWLEKEIAPAEAVPGEACPPPTLDTGAEQLTLALDLTEGAAPEPRDAPTDTPVPTPEAPQV